MPRKAQPFYAAGAFAYGLGVFAFALDRLTTLDVVPEIALTATLAIAVALAVTVIRSIPRAFWYAALAVAVPPFVISVGSLLLEVSGWATEPPGDAIVRWIQVRDIRAEHRRLADAGVRVSREPRREPWGLEEMWIADPDGVPIVLVEIPENHPLRRDQRYLVADDE